MYSKMDSNEEPPSMTVKEAYAIIGISRMGLLGTEMEGGVRGCITNLFGIGRCGI